MGCGDDFSRGEGYANACSLDMPRTTFGCGVLSERGRSAPGPGGSEFDADAVQYW